MLERKISRAAVPVREGYDSKAGTAMQVHKAWDLANDTVMSDMTLYARWMEEDKYSVYEENQRTDLKDCMIASVKSNDGKLMFQLRKLHFRFAGKAKKLSVRNRLQTGIFQQCECWYRSVTVCWHWKHRGRKNTEFLRSVKKA